MTLNIKILESSLAKIKNHTVDFSASFYDKLFAIHPELKILFKNVELTAQEQKLMASLAVIVENLRNPEQYKSSRLCYSIGKNLVVCQF